MAKDSYWFRHDASAGRGLRMRKMAHIYGHWGKGIYWDVIEILRDQSDYSFQSDGSSLQMLADLIGCKDESRFLNWFNDCIKFELFIIKNNRFFSEVLCENMETWEIKKNNGSKGGRPTKTEKEPKPKPKRKLNETIREENSIEENNIPTENEFLEYCKTIKEFNYSEYEYSLQSKFQTWKGDGWKDGNGNEIKNWKMKIRNTYPHLKPIKQINNGSKLPSSFGYA